MTNSTLYDSVRAINNTYRTALMNRKYYGYRLSLVKNWNVGLEIVIAVGTSLAIGAWVIWRSPVGENTWENRVRDDFSINRSIKNGR